MYRAILCMRARVVGNLRSHYVHACFAHVCAQYTRGIVSSFPNRTGANTYARTRGENARVNGKGFACMLQTGEKECKVKSYHVQRASTSYSIHWRYNELLTIQTQRDGVGE